MAILLNGCSPKQQHISIAYVDWQESIAMTYITQEIFENQGYTTHLIHTDIESVFDSLKLQQADIFMDVWLPISHKNYVLNNASYIECLGLNFEHGQIGLAVPEYVPITYISQLEEYAIEFNNQIIGVETGAGIMKATEEVIKAYVLSDYQLQYTNEAKMIEALDSSIEQNEWIVVTAWKPHWINQHYQLKYLKDPLKMYGLSEIIQTYSWNGFSDEDEFASQLLDNIHFTDQAMNDLLYLFHLYSNPQEAAKIWVNQNSKLVNSWIPQKKEPRIIF